MVGADDQAAGHLTRAFSSTADTETTGATGTGWPELSASRAEPCDDCNPLTERRCELGYHDGYHRDATGAEWLDD